MKTLGLIFCFLLTALPMHAQREEYSWDTITFEEPCAYLSLDTSASNIWKIGNPDMQWLDGPYEGANCLFTNGEGAYPVNNHSAFTLMINASNVDHYPYSVYFEMMHRMDAEKGKDGGYIDVSYDGGVTWENIIEDQSACMYPGDGFETRELYTQADTLINGEYGFSGEVHAWTKVRFGWEYCLTKSATGYKDTMLLRFNFISDNHDTPNEGWSIDRIRLFSMKLTGHTGNDAAGQLMVYPNPAKDRIQVRTLTGNPVDHIRLFNISGKELRSGKGTSALDIDGFPAGVYFLQVTSGNQVFFKKMIKQE